MNRIKTFFKIWKTRSQEETIEKGKRFAKMLKPGMTVGLLGNLGSGKTTFVKGIALGLGARDARMVKSPTFVILHAYSTKIPLYHLDFYRLSQTDDLFVTGLEEYAFGQDSISVIEWIDQIPSFPERAAFTVKFSLTGENTRTIEVSRQHES